MFTYLIQYLFYFIVKLKKIIRLDVLHVEHLNIFSLSLVSVLEHTLIISLFLSSLLLLDSFQITSSWLDFVVHC